MKLELELELVRRVLGTGLVFLFYYIYGLSEKEVREVVQ